MNYIYKVKCHSACYLNDDEYISFNKDFETKIFTEEIGIFSSLKKSEKFIKDYLKDECTERIIGFNVEKRAIDVGMRGKFNVVCHFDALYSYDKDGNRLFSSEYDEGCEIKFTGRTEDVYFKQHDIALCIENDNIANPVMIVDMPISKCKGGDYSDDSYTVVKCTGCHFHPHVTTLFPILGEITPYIENKLKKSLEKYNLNGF